MTEKNDIIEQLREQFQANTFVRVPRSSEQDDEINLLRADLLDYVGQVRGVVESLLEGHSIETAWLESDQELDTHLADLLRDKPPAEKLLLEDYQRYKQELDRMLELARAVWQEQNTT